MKKFLLSLTLFTALLGVSFSASADACTVTNLIFQVKSYTTNSNGSCTMVFDIGWDQKSNNGSEYSIVHLWLANNYPTTAYTSPLSPAEINNSNSFGTIVIQKGVISAQYPSKNGAGSPVILSGNVTKTTLASGGYRFLIENVTKTFANCPSELSIKGDVWASNSNQGNVIHCIDAGLTFLPPIQDLNVSGSLTCGFKDGLPDNKFSVEMTSSAASALTVKYDVFVDNGDGSFNAAEDLKVNYRTVTGQSISNTATYSVSMLDYAPYSKDYAFINRNLWINAAATTSLGNQFTRLYKISNTCQTTNPIPAPTVNPDYFVLGMDGWEGNTSLKAHVYGNNTKWSNDPMAADYQVSSLSTSPALNSGTDGDNTDAPLSAMKFIFSGLQLENGPACQSATPNLGTLVVNEKGFFEYTIGDLCVNVVSFTYTVQNNLSGLSSAPIKVTIQIANPIILPVSYKSFSATRSSNSQVILEWETAMEENNRGFHVQRNTDGSWKNIGFVFSAAQGGNSSEVLKYAFKDANGSKGITQYRILQVDMDGKGKYSEVRAVRGLETAAARVTLFPNPSSTGTFNLMFEDGSSLRDVVVSDVSGRVVKQYKAVSGNTLTVDGLTDGFYTVQVANRNSGTTSIEKVIIKKR